MRKSRPAPPPDPIATRFGFEDVQPRDKQDRVNRVFSKVAERYDLMNDLMSGGLHRLWKGDLINWLAPPKAAPQFKLLDVAGGTGDIAMRFCDAAGDGARAVLCDISPEMLTVGLRRVRAAGLNEKIAATVGNAEALPFRDKSFDAYTIAFGIRNVTQIDAALGEAYRVLRPGGRFMCLEFSKVQMPMLDRLYDFHSFQVIPRLGELAAGDAQPYQYLVESIRNFPGQDEFKAMIGKAGFSRVAYRNLTGGIAAIHSAWRI